MLFNLPKREEVSIKDVMDKIKSGTTVVKPKITLRGTALVDKIKTIGEVVRANLGDYKYKLITTDDDFINYCKQASTCEYVAIDTETAGLSFKEQGTVAGICLMGKGMIESYAPVGHISPTTETAMRGQVSKEGIIKGLKILHGADTNLVFHNAYYDIVVLYLLTGLWFRVYADTHLIAFTLNENEPHDLKYLHDKYVADGNEGVHRFNDLFDGIPIIYINPKIAGIYSAKDARMTADLYEFQLPFITKTHQDCIDSDLVEASDILYNIEFPLVRVLAEMRVRGIEIDYGEVEKLRIKYTKLKDEALVKFNEAVSVYKNEILLYNQSTLKPLDYPINYNSPAQIKALFYDIIKTGVIFKKEPTGTGKHVIDELLTNSKYANKPIYNIAKYLNEVKKYDKLIGSFIDKLSEEALEYGGVVHCNYNACGARTSRLSSSNPNLQQIPSRNADIRNMFTAGEGRVFVFADYSQQEMMAMASLANDTKMLESFALGRDIYSHIASIAFGVPYEECLEFRADGSINKEGKDRRKKSKAITLGIAYGKGVTAIAEDLHITVDKAQEVKDSVLGAFPELAQYLRDVVTFGKNYGYVKDFYGRKRRLPSMMLPEYEITVPNAPDEFTEMYYRNTYLKKLRQVWKREDVDVIIKEGRENGVLIVDNRGEIAKETREAYNSPIQSSAACISKLSLLEVFNNKRLQELDAKLCLTIHDEGAVTCPIENAYEVAQLMEKCFIDAGKALKAKLRCDVVIESKWGKDDYKIEDGKVVKK